MVGSENRYEAYGQQIPIQDLTIDFLRSQQEQKSMFTVMPNEIMKNGLWVDIQSVNLLVQIHDTLSTEKGREKFRRMIRTPTGFCQIVDKMWSWIK
jgi:hypothetical protein